jgi:type II secretory pathway component PulM
MKLLALERLGARERYLLLAMVVVCLSLIVDLLFVRPVGRRIDRMETDINVKKQQVSAQLAVLASETTVAQEYESLRGVIGVAQSPSVAIDEMKGEIDELARKHGLVLQSMDHREGAKRSACQEFLVEIAKCEADFQDLLRFLCSVQDAPGLLRVERVNLTPVGVGDRVKGSILISKAMIVSEP